ncbi:transmembrane protein 229B isoform X2 [Lissotriton helveticus]
MTLWVAEACLKHGNARTPVFLEEGPGMTGRRQQGDVTVDQGLPQEQQTRQSRTSRWENSGAQKRWKTRNPGIQEVILAKHQYFHLRQGREKQYYQNSTWHLIQQHRGTTKLL